MADSKYFSQEDKEKILLWCDRHCCLCGKPCGLDIEIAHIIPKSSNTAENKEKSDIDNAIPLCFNCHAAIGRYRSDHPKGTKYKNTELKTRREQIYEKYTRHLVPPIYYQIYQDINTIFPNSRLLLKHNGDVYPIKILLKLVIFLGGNMIEIPNTPNGLYNGKTWWNLNPQEAFNGWFPMNPIVMKSDEDVEVRINLKIMDIYERIHDLLPVGYVYMRNGNSWFLEPGESLHKETKKYNMEGWGKFGLSE